MVHTLAAILLAATAATAAPKNVILLIGDGFGPAHVTLTKNLRGENFRIGTMPVIGLYTTHCADRAVTDSAAGASALATGVKTNYEMLSLDPATGQKVPTVLEKAEQLGKATGLVTTSYFWDATPAAFAAHAKHRNESLDIARQITNSGVDVVASSGLQRFGLKDIPAFADFAASAGYTPITTRAELDAARGTRFLAAFPSQERDLDVPDAPLSVLAAWAIDRLDDDPEGFFLMIEHEGIDATSHQNNGPDLRKVLTSFDEAAGVALDFAARRGDTLVIVAADHETGGIRVSETRQLARLRIEWSTTDHTGVAIPVFAYGPGASAFAGFQDNTDVGKKIIAAVTAPAPAAPKTKKKK
jgi:alkaline phosphatase